MRRKSLGSALMLVACAGQSLDVGNDSSGHRNGAAATDGATGGGTDGGTGCVVGSKNGGSTFSGGGTSGTTSMPSSSLAEWPAQGGCASDAAAQGVLGTWRGQLEDFYLQPLTPLTLVINGASSHGMCGSLKWGDAAPPPQPTDPQAPYPAPQTEDELRNYGGAPGYTPFDGFTYTITQGAVRDGSVRFSIGTRELWESWCELQTSYPTAAGYNCIPSDEGYSSGPDATSPCVIGKRTFSTSTCWLCQSGVCACDEQGCRASSSDGDFEIALTLSSDGKLLTGPADERATETYQTGAAYYLQHAQ